MAKFQNLFVVGSFLTVFSWLLIVHRRETDRTHIFRTFSPFLLVVKFPLLAAFFCAIAYFYLALLLPGIWALVLVVWIGLSYAWGKVIKRIGYHEIADKLKDGKILVWGMGNEFQQQPCQ